MPQQKGVGVPPPEAVSGLRRVHWDSRFLNFFPSFFSFVLLTEHTSDSSTPPLSCPSLCLFSSPFSGLPFFSWLMETLVLDHQVFIYVNNCRTNPLKR